jgi:nicotinamidase-related amidase
LPTLLIIDIQRDYFPGGASPLVGPERAASRAREVLDHFRGQGQPVVHLKHVWDEPEATFMRPGTDGVEIHELVAPGDGELVIEKTYPNGFRETTLEQVLRTSADDEVVIAGMMSSMCVDATARAAVDLGFQVTIVHDACAAPSLEFADVEVPGEQVHAAFMAALADYGAIVGAQELINRR